MSTTNKKHPHHGKRIMFPGTSDDGKLLDFVEGLPKRADFIDKKALATIDKSIANSKNLLFLPNDLLEQHYMDGKKLTYKILLMGVMQGGAKAAVVLNNIKVFFDVRVPDNAEPDKFAQAIKKVLKEDDIFCSNIEEIQRLPFKYFRKAAVPYLRIYFPTLHGRKKAISRVGNSITYFNKDGEETSIDGLETANDDATCYYRKVAREYKFKLAGWNLIRKYKIATPERYTKEKCYQYTFEVDVDDFVDIEKSALTTAQIDAIPDIKKDKSLVMCWDLETDDLQPTGSAPMPDDVFDSNGEPRAIIEMDCCSFFWQYDTNPLLVVAISVMPSPARDDCLIIQVKDQMDLIKVKALLVESMAPDFVTGFRDGLYDWPFINRRAQMYDQDRKTKYVEFMKKHMSTIPYTPNNAKWAIKGIKNERRIKVEADTNVDIENYDVPGFVCIDTQLIFRQLFPTAEKTSLNFFLAINKLGSKEDMAYITMFKIFRLMRQLVHKYKTRDYNKIVAALKKEQAEHGDNHCPLKQNADNPAPKFDDSAYNVTKLNIKDIMELISKCSDVIHYCNVDSKRCQDLLNVRNVIPDKREVVNISYTSMYDSFYRAGGMKVRNLVIATANEPEWNLAVSNATEGNEKDKRKYPGAYVVPPKKGLYRDHKIVKRRRRQLAEETASSQKDAGADSELIGLTQRFSEEEVDPVSEHFIKELLKDELFEENTFEKRTQKAKSSNDDNDRCDRPCFGLDFSSLYPSLIMTFNLSPEKIVLDDEEAKQLMAEGYKLHRIDFHYKLKDEPETEKSRKTGWAVLHEPNCDEKGQWTYKNMGIYPYILKQLFDQRKQVKKKMDYYMAPKEYIENIMKEKDFNALSITDGGAQQREYVRAFIAKDIAGKQALVDANRGTRKEGYYGYQIKHVKEIEKFLTVEGFLTDDFPAGKSESKSTLQKMYPEVLFFFTYYNSKQLALKVFMNTFYGETGNSLSPFFLVQVAGGITMAGQKNLKKVRTFVESEGYNVLYGDTDSLYLCCPERVFVDLDNDYVNGKITKLQYWTGMIETTMETADVFKEEVNGMLRKDNGTPFLTMAYEEVLWPYMMVGKKKYCGVQHQGIVNLAICMPECKLSDFMKSKSLFMRGLEVKKRGASEFLKILVYEALKDVFCITQTMTLREVCEEKISGVAKRTWDPSLFIKTSAYKQAKAGKPGNPTVLNFVERMTHLERTRPELGIKPPELGQRFNHVIVKKYPWTYGLRGTQVEIKVADKCEFYESLANKDYQKHLGVDLEIDLDYYMLNEVIGQFGRLVVYHPFYDKFGAEKPMDEWDDDDYKSADEKAIKYAKKVMQKYYKDNFATQYQKRGKEYQNIFKAVNAKVNEWRYDKYGDAAVIFDVTSTIVTGADRNENDFTDAHIQKAIFDKITKETDKIADKDADKRVIARIKQLSDARKKNGATLYELYTVYVSSPNAICKVQRNILSKRLVEEEKKLKNMLGEYQNICFENVTILDALVGKVRSTAVVEGGLSAVGEQVGIKVDYAIVERGLDHLRNTNKVKFSKSDIDDLVIAIGDTPVEETEPEEPIEEPLEESDEDRRRVEFVYDLFDNYTRIIAIKRTLYEINKFEDHLKHARKTKAGVIQKPPGVKLKSDVEDFSRFIKKRIGDKKVETLVE